MTRVNQHFFVTVNVIYGIEHNWRTECVNNFKGKPKSRLKIIRGTKNKICLYFFDIKLLHIFYKKEMIVYFTLFIMMLHIKISQGLVSALAFPYDGVFYET